ncbi:flavin-containing monooxygenase [Mycobacteroides chelonae]|uniref:Monooxygenase n=1 Tax=Mycobacteroides chelonae TaxID=1774 RepID=A0A1S1M8D9_MYCCH|nr:NAD(P)/FAD-dependent oxidoreductase [Mycobacteroides chelonae]OHU78175.1 monooxygenase [Mycobacteroides chelonae]QQG86641.1 NAD(P)/FAD-dependent oxidoreductase [Mycobacteroides chelonae]QQG91458.1 NAD(P)/FAD-dependent oxidoreductase [Mycobacteroides chelonae]
MAGNGLGPDYQVAIIGAGPAGIAAAAKLRRAGIDDFVIIERADDVGGSWHENHYPGLGVDIPGVTYQYSFARNPKWSRFFPLGAEVKRYHVEVAARFGLYERTRFNCTVEREVWDDSERFWRLHMQDGSAVTARFVISAVGAFVRPKDDVGIPGAKSFKGKVQRPSCWDDDYDMSGKTVAIIGTGASAVQIVPAIAPEVSHLTVFQRTPVWTVPKPDFEVPRLVQMLLAAPGVVPALHGAILVVADLVLRTVCAMPSQPMHLIADHFDTWLISAYRRYIRMVVEDPGTADKLTPNFGVLAKRPTTSNSYLRAYNRNNVTLVTEPIEKITATGVRTRDGVLHKVDVLILATGYEVFSDPETYRAGTIVGRDGFDLATFYQEEGLQAYQSVSVHGLPNRWTLVGPYSWTGSGWHAFVEMTADHAVRAITEARRRRATVCEIRKDVAERYHRDIYARGEVMRYYLAELNGHVPTYYRNSQGDSTYIRPSGFFEASRGNRRFPLDDYCYQLVVDAPVQAPLTIVQQRSG